MPVARNRLPSKKKKSKAKTPSSSKKKDTKKKGKSKRSASAIRTTKKMKKMATKPVGDVSPEPKLKGDYLNVCVLLLLYTLQGVPMGISAAIPMLLVERKVSMSVQGKFSFCSWPFSLKLLWAPIVDAVFMTSWGQRKTWLVPSQLLIGFVMIFSSYTVDGLMDTTTDASDGNFDITLLTGIFFILFFLCATQDIAVDGWALTMLKKENIGYAATCNAAGQTLGNTLSFVGFLALNKYNIASIGANMRGWGILFLLTTVLIAAFKPEKPSPAIPSVKEAYIEMWSIFRLPAVQSLCLVMFVSKIAFAPGDAMNNLKIQGKGMPKEHMAIFGTFLGIISILLPGFIAKKTAGQRPFQLFTGLYIPRLLLNIIVAFIIYFAPTPVHDATIPLPLWYYVIVFAAYVLVAILSTAMFLGQVGLFAKISDPRLGGTYMTLLNTVANLAFKWPSTLVYFLVDIFTRQSMEVASDGTKKTTITMDGYYPTVFVCALIGIWWKMWSRERIHLIENGKREQWLVSGVDSYKKGSDDDDEEAGISLISKN